MRAPVEHYRSIVADSARWNNFRFRHDDIVISSPIKCGTTWVQMICALLIFRQSGLPHTLDRISPWLDMIMRPLEDIVRDLEAQQHRRFIKSHTPLDGLPLDDRATYICIGRDPRDVALSFDNHMANMNVPRFLAALEMQAGPRQFPRPIAPQRQVAPETSRERFWRWIESPDPPCLRAMVHHLATFWEARDRPNIVLLHYDELKDDLEGRMRWLAHRLHLEIREEIWPDLVRAASFEEMREHADEIVPNVTAKVWHDNSRFFNKGTSGQWDGLLDDEELRRYEAHIMELATPDLAAWMHHRPVIGS